MAQARTTLSARIFRWLVRRIDLRLRRRRGVVEFSARPDCLIRIAFHHLDREVSLADGSRLHKGDLAAELHLWNERLLPIPAHGPDFRWALTLRRQVTRSLRLLAAELMSDPGFSEVKAVVMKPAFAGKQVAKLSHVLARHGFERVAAGARPEARSRLHHFFDNVWLWLLSWTFNPMSLRGWRFERHRLELWVSSARFIAMYGGKPHLAENADRTAVPVNGGDVEAGDEPRRWA